MDPWKPQSNIEDRINQQEARIGEDTLQFESSFISDFPKYESLITFEKLPDSADYLARLEAKLGKLQTKSDRRNLGGSRRVTESGLVQELEQAKQAALSELVSREGSVAGRSDQEVQEDREVRTGYIVRRLLPEQPVCQGEKVELTKADHLENQVEEEKEEKVGKDQELSD